MRNFPGYTMMASVCETGDFFIFRASKHDDHRSSPVIIKFPASQHPHPSLIRCLEQEYGITHDLNAASILKPLQLERHGDKVALVLEDCDCQTLAGHLSPPMPIGQFLRTAINITNALAEIHNHDLVHKDIKPQHIFRITGTDEVRITGFG